MNSGTVRGLRPERNTPPESDIQARRFFDRLKEKLTLREGKTVA